MKMGLFAFTDRLSRFSKIGVARMVPQSKGSEDVLAGLAVLPQEQTFVVPGRGLTRKEGGGGSLVVLHNLG